MLEEREKITLLNSRPLLLQNPSKSRIFVPLKPGLTFIQCENIWVLALVSSLEIRIKWLRFSLT